MNYTFIALVENKPGVLNRVASLFRRRNFNIESLAVGRTDNPSVSRMTIVVDCPNGDDDAHRIEANLYKLVNVIDVQDVTHQPSVTRDLALIKVQVGPERRAEVNGLADIFRGRILDVTDKSYTIELTGTGSKLDALTRMLEVEEDFDAAIATLKQNNVKFRMEPMETPVCHMAMVFDPDGNTLCIHKRKQS